MRRHLWKWSILSETILYKYDNEPRKQIPSFSATAPNPVFQKNMGPGQETWGSKP